MTIKLYDKDAYMRTFAARVTGCRQKGSNYSVTLDRTAFYPEGGGQPSDRGVLGSGNVLDVKIRGEEIFHLTDRPLSVGSVVFGGINWPRRFRLMQQHTGEHIVSGIANRLFSAENVGFHMGEKFLTVDWDRTVGKDGLELIELLANEAVCRNLPVRAEYPPKEALEKIRYRSKKELSGAIRIVTVPGYDVCACCGTHVARTGEIGAIKILSSQNYKGGTRITMACGFQAMEDYGDRLKITAALSSLLSAKEEKIESSVRREVEENAELKRQISALKGRFIQREVSGIPENSGNTCLFFEELPSEDLRRFAVSLCGRCGGIAAVFSGGNGKYRYAVAASGRDVRPFGKTLNAAFQGRGGGSPELVQGAVRGKEEEIKEFFRKTASGQE